MITIRGATERGWSIVCNPASVYFDIEKDIEKEKKRELKRERERVGEIENKRKLERNL